MLEGRSVAVISSSWNRKIEVNIIIMFCSLKAIEFYTIHLDMGWNGYFRWLFKRICQKKGERILSEENENVRVERIKNG